MTTVKIQRFTLSQEKKRRLMLDAIPFLGVLLILGLFAATTNGRFVRLSNLILIFKQSAIVMIGAIGATFTLAHGNLDFSLGGELALCCLLSYYASTINPYLILPACIFIGLLLSFTVSMVHVILGVPVFIVGLCVMFIGKGIVQSVSGSGLYAPRMYSGLDTPLFYFLAALLVIVLAIVLFNYTRIGRYNKAIGSNTQAALLSGVPVNRYKLLAFLISGVTVGIAAFLTMVRTGGVTAQSGQTFEIDCMIVMVLGGVPLSGGSGVKIKNGVLGAFILYMLNNGLLMWGVSAEIIYIIKGILFLAIVTFTYDRNNGQEIF